MKQMQTANYTTKFKDKALRQLIDGEYSFIDVFQLLGTGDCLLYNWIAKCKVSNDPTAIYDTKPMQAMLKRLKTEFRRTLEKSDML